jgi:hypothetical protein
MAEVYGREYVLQFVRQPELIQRSIPNSIIRPNSDYVGQSREVPSLLAATDQSFAGYSDFVTVNKEGVAKEITQLQMKATVNWGKEGTAGSNPQESLIEVYNLSPITRKFLRKNDTVLLRAGYTQTYETVVSDKDGTSKSRKELPLVVTGQARRIVTKKVGQNTITKIFIKDAGFVADNLRTSRRYEEGTTYREVIEDLAAFLASAGIPTGNLDIGLQQFTNFDYTDASGKQPLKDLNNDVGVQGMAISGYALNELSSFCAGIGYRAYTSLGKLYVEPIYSGGIRDYVIILPENIKGTIREEVDTSSKNETQGDAKSGIIFDTFLNGKIKLNVGVKIKGIKEYEGSYKVTSITHKLDLEGKDWTTEVSCIKETL